VLFQLVYHCRDDLERAWEDRFQPTYGVLRDEVLTTFDEYMNCGILALGAARVYCDTCKHSILLAFSCKRRGVCPSCGAKRAVKFAEHVYAEVLDDVPHRHIVFTIPKRIRSFFKYDRKLLSILFRAAREALKDVFTKDGGSIGAILTAQTAGESLNFHPHLHGLLANGIWGEEDVFSPFTEIDLKSLTIRFAERVLAALCKKGLVDESQVVQILRQEHTGFSVWLGEPFHDQESSQFVARYIERGPLSLEKLSLQDDIVTYTTKDNTAHDFDALEFLALLSAQIPRTYESICRYIGRYSSRNRGERKKKAAALTLVLGEERKLEVHEPPRKPSSWAACIKRIYEVDPLECPKCRSTMRIVAFIQDEYAIRDIMKSQGIPDFRPPPRIPKYIDTSEALDNVVEYDLIDPEFDA